MSDAGTADDAETVLNAINYLRRGEGEKGQEVAEEAKEALLRLLTTIIKAKS